MQGSDLGGKPVNGPDVRWRVTTPDGVQFTCRVQTTGTRVEVRLMTGDEELLCVSVVPTLDVAGTVARRWLRAVVAGESVSDPSAPEIVIH